MTKQDQNPLERQRELLLKIARTRMPFGRYQGRALVEIPEAYLVWFAREGFAPTELGEMLRLLLELKTNGLTHLLRPLAPRKK